VSLRKVGQWCGSADTVALTVVHFTIQASVMFYIYMYVCVCVCVYGIHNLGVWSDTCVLYIDVLCLKHCATSRKVAGSIPDGVEIFH
jgi:ABC-type long-subunit fatty acid transport system fused permease/ATPase subunit